MGSANNAATHQSGGNPDGLVFDAARMPALPASRDAWHDDSERLRVLVADDEALVAEGLALQLEALGHDVVGIARTGREALRRVREAHPDMLVLDIRMGGDHGLDVCRELMADRPLPVLIVTSRGDHDLIAEAEKCGASGYLLKPSDERRLDAAIMQARARFASREGSATTRRASEGARHNVNTRPLTPRHDVARWADGTRGTDIGKSLIVEDGTRSGARIRVLLVDSHQLLARALAMVLGAEPDLDVIGTQRDPVVALDHIRRSRPDVVLLSYPLLCADGAELVDALRSEFPEIKILILTSVVDEGTLLTCIQAGAVGCVAKDRPPTELVRSIKRVHTGEVLFAPNVLVRLLTSPAQPPKPESTQVRIPLGPRELEVLQCFAAGMTTDEVAAQLNITIHTVRTHLKKVMSKLGARTKLEAVMFALKYRVITLSD